MKSEIKIESVAEEEKNKSLPVFDPVKTYVKDSFIDICDRRTWRVAIVTKVENGLLSIRFEGWSEKYNENNIKSLEFRVAPFRRHTKGYTGQPNSTYRIFKYDKDQKNAIETRLLELIKDPFVIQDPISYTQFFRGELFFLVDSFLTTMNINKPTVEETLEILDFLKLYLKAIVEWMKVSFQLKDELEAEEKTEEKSKLFYLVNARASVAAAHNDFPQVLKCFFGASSRTKKTFAVLCYNSQHKSLPKGVEEDELEKKSTEWCVEYFYKEFKEVGGLNQILAMVKEGFKLKVLLDFLEVVGELTINILDEEFKSYIIELGNSIVERIRKNDEKDAREIDSIGLVSFFGSLAKISGKYLTETKKSIKNEIELIILAFYLKSENLIRKVNAIEQIKSNYDIINFTKKFSTELKEPKDKVIDAAIKFLKNIGIVKLLFTDFPHPELIKRSMEIIQLLILAKEFKTQDVDTLITCYNEKHEEMRIPILNLFIRMGEYAPYPIIEKIFAEFEKVSISTVNETYLKAVSLYIKAVLKNIDWRSQKEKKAIKDFEKQNKSNKGDKKDPKEELDKELFESNYKLYDLDLLWNVIVYSKKEPAIEIKLKDLAIAFLLEVINTREEFVMKFLARASSDIKQKAEHTIRCMKFLIACYNSLETKWNIKEWFEKNTGNESKILDTVIESLYDYKKKVKKEFVNCWRHDEFVKGHIEFMEFILRINDGEVKLTENQLDTLWNVFVAQAICQEETNFFYLQLIRKPEKQKGQQEFTLVTQKNIEYLFETYFNNEKNFPISALNNISYTTFKTLFSICNLAKKRLKQKNNKNIVVNEDLIGMKYLWNFPFYCTDKEVIEEACKYIISLYVSLGSNLEEKCDQFARSFLSYALLKAEQSGNTKEGNMLAIKMIKSYLKESEGSKYCKIDKSVYKAEPLMQLKIEVKHANRNPRIKKLGICGNLTIFHLKNAISAMLKEPLNQFKLIFKPKNVNLNDAKYNKVIIKEVMDDDEVKFLVEIQKPTKSIESTSSYVISNFKNGREKLLKLMKLDEDFAEEVWILIKGFPDDLSTSKIPTDEELSHGKLLETWENTMTSNNDLHTLLWNVHVMKRLILERQPGEVSAEDYIQQGLKKGLFIYLTEKYKQFAGMLKEKSYIKARLVKYIVKVLNAAIIPPNVTSVNADDSVKETVLKTALKFLEFFVCEKGTSGMDTGYSALINEIAEGTFTLINNFGCSYTAIMIRLLLGKPDIIYEILKSIWTNPNSSTLLKPFCNIMLSVIKASKCEYIKCLVEYILIRPLKEPQEVLLLFGSEYFNLCCKSTEEVLSSCFSDINSSYLEELSKTICSNSKLGVKGLLEVLVIFYKKFKDKTKNIGCLDKLMAVVQELAFNLEEGNKKIALELLEALCEDNKTYIRSTLAKFYTLIREPKWRTDLVENWEIYVEDRQLKEGGRAKFTGLENPANSTS